MKRIAKRAFLLLFLGAFLCALPAVGQNVVINGAFELGKTKFKDDYWTMDGYKWGITGCDIYIPSTLPYPGLNTTYTFWAMPVSNDLFQQYQKGYITQPIFVEAGRTYHFEADVQIFNC